MAVSNINDGITTQQATQSASNLSANLNTFLTLLTTQLQHQDPLSPMDTSEFTNQLVLYTQAEQQIRTNDSLTTLINLQRGSVGTQALGYIGMDVAYTGNEVYSSEAGEDQTFVYSLAETAHSMSISIKDKDGNVVRTLEGDLAAGDHELVWDGLDSDGDAVPVGSYTINVNAQNDSGTTIKTATLVHGRVNGLESDGNGSVMLTLLGDKTIDLSTIYSVWKPSNTTTTTQQSS